MKILVTGGAGFIGSHYADALIDRGDEVTVFDGNPQVHEFRARYIRGDLRDRDAVDKAVRGQDYIIHAGGILGTHETVETAYETSETNILGGINILEAVRKHGAGIISISKPNVWLNPYSITKDCLEKFCFAYVNEFDLRVAIVKLFNVYGPRQKYTGVRKAIPTWIVNALRREPIEIFGEGTSTMDLVHTRDVVDGTIGIIENFDKCCVRKSAVPALDVYSNFSVYNEQVLELGSGRGIAVNKALENLNVAMGRIPMEVRHIPMRRGELDGSQLRANISRLSTLTGFKPKMSLGVGLKDTVEYYEQNLKLIEQGKL
jgi:UDP-glucose 4-epimerase